MKLLSTSNILLDPLDDFLGGTLAGQSGAPTKETVPIVDGPPTAEVTPPKQEVEATPKVETPPTPSADPKPDASKELSDAEAMLDDLLGLPKEKKADASEQSKVDPTKPETPPTPTPNQPTTPQVPVTRDYTGFDEADVKIFKQMSNEAFARVKPIYEEHRKLKGIETEFANYKKATSEPTYLDETGYVHNKDFQNLYGQSNELQALSSFWQDQLIKIESGEKFQMIQVDENGRPKLDAGGNFLVTPEIDPSPKAKIGVQSYLTRLQTQYNNVIQKQESIKAEYTTKIKNAKDYWKKLEDEHFPNLKDAKDNQIIKTLSETLAENGQQFNPLAGLFTKTVATLAEAVAANSQLKAEIEKLKKGVTSSTQVQSTPSNQITQGAVAGNRSKDNPTIDDVSKEFDELLGNFN